ncbi:MAG TPA: hypothetical protein VG102_01985 [Candidatus Paceibacterota bacterium]|jgi:hypothetical protein|nr:hypothetical protein [Candidatus Paceibacterota bacterium]
MLREEDIVGRLEKIGYKNADIRAALRDVSQIIITKTAAAYLARFPQQEQEHLRTLSEEQLQNYLAEHTDVLPKMSQEEFEKIHDETWEDYFRSVA